MQRPSLSKDRAFALWAAGLFGLGLLMRFHQIGEFELWLDEALTGYLAHSDDWLQRVHNSPPLYFLLVRAWAGFFGLEEASLRALSALSSALLVPLAMYTGRSVFSREAGLAAGIVVVLSPLGLYYGQEARPYALLVSELMFVYWMLWRTAFATHRGDWLLLLCGTAAAIYTHNLAVIPLALGYLLALVHAWTHADWARLRSYFMVGGAAVGLYIPWFVWWLNTTEFHPEDMQWLMDIWNLYTTWRLPLDSIFVFYHAADLTGANVIGTQFIREPALAGMTLLSIVGVLVFSALTAHTLWLNEQLRPGAAAALVLLVGPLLALLAISVWKPLYLRGRYDLIAYPAFVLLAGLCLSMIVQQLHGRRGKLVAYALCVVLLAPPVARTAQFYGAEKERTAAPAADYIHQHAEEGDLVLMEGRRGIRTLYYLRLSGYVWENGECRHPDLKRRFACRLLPISMETAPAAITRHWRAQRDGSLTRNAESIAKAQSYRDLFLLVKQLNDDSDPLQISGSMAPVVAELYELGYVIHQTRADLRLLHFRAE